MASTVIVALPAEDDYVWKISSEKVPHLTLLYLGEEFDDTNLEETVKFVQHIAKTSLSRFGLSVDRRGKLGENDADVVFFDKSYGIKDLEKIRGYLLTDHAISTAYNKTSQHLKWIPHLTLGFPDTPAKPDNRDYPGVHWVNFDRIAIWTEDYSGPEFRLEADSGMEMEIAMSSDSIDLGASFIEAFLDTDVKHYGVKGMRWGHRKSEDMVDTGVRTTSTAKLDAKASAKTNKANAKADKKFIKENTGMNGFIKVNNSIADKINPRLDEMNKKYSDDVDLMDPKNSAIQKKYANEYKSILQKSLDEVAAEIGTNASGTVKAELKVVDHGYPDISYEYTLVEVKHAGDEEPFVQITPKFDKLGRIVGQEFKIVIPEVMAHSEEFAEFDELMHYGVKGMKWGVRRSDRTPTGVELKTTPGRKVKAKGGKFEEPSEDAKRTAAQKQKARKSSTDALSNQELKQLVERMQLEANFDRLAKQQQGSKILKKLFTDKKLREQSVENIRGIRDTATRPIRDISEVGESIRKADLSGIGR